MSSVHPMSNWLDKLQSQGRYTFTRAQAESETGRSFVAAQSALRRLKANRRLACPRRGFYVIVPPEYRPVGSPPATWFVDELMAYMDQPYYVGLLSAAAIHGAAHQQPMVFQVITSKPTRMALSGKVSLQFVTSSRVENMPVVERQTETGTMRVATPETTAFDLVRYPSAVGHFSNVAMVLSELAEQLDPVALAHVASLVRLPDVQRLGYLLEVVGAAAAAEHLLLGLKKRNPRPIKLSTQESVSSPVDNRWNVIPNAELELDL